MWKAVIISLLGILIAIQSVDAITCRSSYGSSYSCSSGRYCCGTSSCCTYTDESDGLLSLWYLWVGIVILFVIISGASGAYYRHRKRMLLLRTHPAPTVQASAVQQTMAVSATASSGNPGHPPPPPAYNQGIDNTKPNMGVAPNPAGPSVDPPV
ncbi:uncharacterized protein LOC105443996 [Strongylocentrotus purpuratus]|uniref:WW domain binding protein VOPP1 n=1 Tax=Strongylocentrotus purpuratus TaxID=7668 RepID=A0A7M7P456_STRPU|nr:uncharacterized protein LOC105443996 [Strongylocentrotus purpuratus]